MRRHDDGENGQVLILVTIFLLVLVCFVAMAADVGLMFRYKRNMQIAADAGAVAGAIASRYGGATSVTTAAQNAALANGVTDVSYVTVDTSPSAGYHTGAGFVRVTISQPKSTLFMRVANITSIPIGAVSVAGTVPNIACMIALDTGQQSTFNVQGSATVNAPNCAIHINSSSKEALCSTGNATITSPFIGINGYQDKQGSCNGTQTNVSSDNGIVKDPYANIPWLGPTAKGGNGTCDGTHPYNPVTGTGYENTMTSVTSTTVLQSTTPAGVSATVYCFTQPVTIASGTNLGTTAACPDNATLTCASSSAIYVFENGVTFAGNSSVAGAIDIQGGNYTATTNQVSMYAYAGLSGTYNSLALMVDPSNTTVSCQPSINPITLTSGSNACLEVQFGSGGFGAVDGIIYAPNATVYMQDNGGSTTVAGIISGAIYDKASTLSIPANYNIAHASTTPMSTTAMVE